MALPLKKDQRYTYSDYCTWPDDERWEIVDGDVYDMSPAPTLRHQKISGRIYNFLEIALKDKPCVAFIAPTDVVLSEYDVVQPDILVVCDKKKMTEANIQGAPDLVIEILSPSTSLKDIREKRDCYEKYGVKEYIIVHPTDRYVQRFSFDKPSWRDFSTPVMLKTIFSIGAQRFTWNPCFHGKKKGYGKGDIFGPDEVLGLKSLKKVEIQLKEVFEDIIPEEIKSESEAPEKKLRS